MAQFASESFTAAAGTTLESLSGWTEHSSSGAGGIIISDVNRARCSQSDVAAYVYYHSGTPSTADYSVSADVVIKNNSGSSNGAGVLARADTVADTYYVAEVAYTGNANEARLRLYKQVAGVGTQLVADTAGFTANADDVFSIKIEVIGTAIKAYKNGVLTLSATDSSISTAGRAGIREYTSGAGNTSGYHMDNFSGDDIATSTILEEDGEWPWVTQNW